MKIGDLVKLSAYGNRRKRADWVQRGDIGVVTKVRPYEAYPDDFLILWQKSPWENVNMAWRYSRLLTRTDLKHAKKR